MLFNGLVLSENYLSRLKCFWGTEGWGASSRSIVHRGIFAQKFIANSKIGNFDSTTFTQQQIIWFDVAVNDALVVHCKNFIFTDRVLEPI